jgi:transmembrane sensor
MKPATQASSWYQNTAGSATIPPHVAERALEWLIDLQDEPVAPELIEEWHCWLNADPDHERAWQRIESINHRLQPLTAPMHAVMAQAVLAAPGSARRRQLVKSLAVLLCVGGGSWGLLNTMQWRTWNADYHTAVGEQRTLVLSDGTELILNTDSAINVQYQEHERRIRLISGELLITTAKDALARPFLIETAQGTAQALGTRYTVRQLAQSTAVNVYQGAVRIRPRQASQQPVVLQAGQQGRYDDQQVLNVAPADQTSPDWSKGFIVARSMRLADLIEELNRYSSTSLSCDPRIGDLRVSGSFPLNDIGKVVDTLAATLDVQAESVTRFWGGKSVRMHAAPASATRRS